MPSYRISIYDREHILRSYRSFTYRVTKLQLSQFPVAADELFEAAIPSDTRSYLAKVDLFNKDLLKHGDNIGFRVHTAEGKFSFLCPNKGRKLQTLGYRETFMVPPDAAVCERLGNWYKQYKAVSTSQRNTALHVKKLLNHISTYNQLFKIWPETAMFLPHYRRNHKEAFRKSSTRMSAELKIWLEENRDQLASVNNLLAAANMVPKDLPEPAVQML